MRVESDINDAATHRYDYTMIGKLAIGRHVVTPPLRVYR